MTHWLSISTRTVQTELGPGASAPETDTTEKFLRAIDRPHAWFAACTQAERKAFRDFVAAKMPDMDRLSAPEWKKNVVTGPATHGACYAIVAMEPRLVIGFFSIPMNNPGEALQMQFLGNSTENLIQMVFKHLFEHKTAVFCGGPTMTGVSLGCIIVKKALGVPCGIGELSAYLRGVLAELARRAIEQDRLRVIGLYSPSSSAEVKMQFGSFSTEFAADMPDLERKIAEYKGDVSDRVAAKIAELFKEEKKELRGEAKAIAAPTAGASSAKPAQSKAKQRAVAIATALTVKHKGARKPAPAEQRQRKEKPSSSSSSSDSSKALVVAARSQKN